MGKLTMNQVKSGIEQILNFANILQIMQTFNQYYWMGLPPGHMLRLSTVGRKQRLKQAQLMRLKKAKQENHKY